jgi:hypothetical protein
MSEFNRTVVGSAVSRVRRNHGLEHATLNILGGQYPHVNMAGHSDVNGFWIIGDIPTADVDQATHQALERMQSGEGELAIHANCGTNFVAAGLLAGVAAWLGMLGSEASWRKRLDRLPLLISLATLAFFFGQPLGLLLQARVTTSGQPGAMQIVDISPSRQGRFPAHRVLTAG